jgi:vacuolar-type H+-ATPase subunit E/Vma4
MKVSELTLEELKAIIGEAVEEKLKELLGDPDAGFELKEHVIERLTASLSSREKGIPFEEAKKRVGLK